jgi:hypothetical protein
MMRRTGLTQIDASDLVSNESIQPKREAVPGIIEGDGESMWPGLAAAAAAVRECGSANRLHRRW